MFNDLYEIEEAQDAADQAEHGFMGSQFDTGEQFPVISAYVESLPNGLIGDEI